MPIKSRHIKLFSEDEVGSVLFEVGIAMPVFLMMILGIIGWSYYLWRESMMLNGVVFAARCEVIPATIDNQKLCVDYQTAGNWNSLGFAAQNSFTSTGTGAQVACIQVAETNPLRFIPYIKLPFSNGANFCRVKLQ